MLAETAAVLSSLHSKGLSYGDTSPGNVFVSEDRDFFESWLIDCDNITDKVSSRAFYTPGYAAPELFHSHGTDTLTDAWSFAVIVFEILSTIHPFNGDLVHDGDPELEEQAFRGELPWVDDSEDPANETFRGLPRDMVLTSSLKKLAQDCFGASRTDRLKRPTIKRWEEKLRQAADQTLKCPECKSTYYFNNPTCPWCDTARPPFVLVFVFLRDLSLTDEKKNPFNLVCTSTKKPSLMGWTIVQELEPKLLSKRFIHDISESGSIVELQISKKTLSLKNSSNQYWTLCKETGGETKNLTERTERLELPERGRSSWFLVPSNPEPIHRVVAFEYYPAEKK